MAYLRSQLFLRDKGKCAGCGLDTLALRRRLFDLSEGDRESVGLGLGFPAHQSRNLMLWEADHMVAVANGGGVEVGKSKAGLADHATLCVRCHIRKTTAELRQRRK